MRRARCARRDHWTCPMPCRSVRHAALRTVQRPPRRRALPPLPRLHAPLFLPFAFHSSELRGQRRGRQLHPAPGARVHRGGREKGSPFAREWQGAVGLGGPWWQGTARPHRPRRLPPPPHSRPVPRAPPRLSRADPVPTPPPPPAPFTAIQVCIVSDDNEVSSLGPDVQYSQPGQAVATCSCGALVKVQWLPCPSTLPDAWRCPQSLRACRALDYACGAWNAAPPYT